MTNRRPLGLWIIGLQLAALLACGDAGATAADPYVDAVLDALQAKGLLSAQEVHDIKLRGRQAARAAAPADAPDPDATSSASATPTAKAFPNFRVWGRLQPRVSYAPSRDGREGTSSFTFRRARLGVEGRMDERIFFRTQYEAASEVPNVVDNVDILLDAWVRFEHLADGIGDIVFGQQFLPGYGRAPQLTASVERKFSEFLSPGAAGRARGLTLRRGDLGAPETFSRGLFGNRLHYGLGIFNGPDLALNNDNNEFLYAAVVGWEPMGESPWLDEYELQGLPFRWGVGASYNTSNDTNSRDTRVQKRDQGLPSSAPDIEMGNDWYTLFTDAHYQRWFGWASWTHFLSRGRDNLLLDTRGTLQDELNSRAWTLGLSRSFALSGQNRFWALALQFQRVDNEHPSRTRFFDLLTGSPVNGVVQGMNRGNAYHSMWTYVFNAKTRLLNEYIYFDVDRGPSPDHDVFVSQLQIDF